MAISTEEEFIAVVEKAERDAAANPGAYKFRLALFAVLGYAVIFLILFLLVAMVGGLVGLAIFSSSILLLLIKKKAIFVILFAIWTFIRALWVKVEAPTGYTLNRKECPRLFAEIDQMSKQLDSLKIHEVILDERFNAAVTQSPRLGVLGWQKNSLILGLELMMALSPEEMRTVLAHEFGHLSGNHSRFSSWIYRVRASWERILSAFARSDSIGARMMNTFFNWYSPYFSAYSFALARANEYEADAIAAEIVSPEAAAKALVNVHVLAPRNDEQYWGEFFEQADSLPEPPHRPFAGLATFLANTTIDADDFQTRLAQQLEHRTDYSDTHPSLKDRVAALSNEIPTPDPMQQSAAELWLGETQLAKAQAHFDEIWMDANSERWTNRYEYVTDSKRTIEECSSKELGQLSDDELWQYVSAVHEFNGDDEAIPLYRAFQERQPDSIGAAYYLGGILARRGDEECLKHLRRAFDNPNTINDAAHAGYNFLTERQRTEESEKWWQDACKVGEQYDAAHAERNVITIDDEYLTPNSEDPVLNTIRDVLARHKNVRHAWVVQKKVTHYPEQPVYVVAFKPKGWALSTEGLQAKVAASLDVDEDVFVLSTTGDEKKLGRKIKKMGLRLL